MKNLKSVLIALMAIMFASTALAQSNGMRVVTGHPDLKLKIKRCEASAKTVVIDMIIENVNQKDVDLRIDSPWNIQIYDDEGNSFDYTNSKVSFEMSDGSKSSHKLPSEIPLKARIQVEGIPLSSQMFKRIDLKYRCEGLGKQGWDYIKIYNVPINREGN